MSKGHLFVVLAIIAIIGGAIVLAWQTGGPADRSFLAKDRQPPDTRLHDAAATVERSMTADRAQLERDFAKTMSGATLRGHMGRRQKREIEAVSPDTPYRLGNVSKLDDQGHWKLEYYIPGTDLLFDMPPVKVEWAGDLPVITISDMQINGKKGIFRARILIDGAEYSGTWSDGTSRGCLFGAIVHEGAEKDRET